MEILDVEEHKKTLKITQPSRAARERLESAQYAKLVFHCPATQFVEYLWVRLTSHLIAGSYRGVIASTPTTLPLKRGQVVIFEPENIADIVRSDDSIGVNRAKRDLVARRRRMVGGKSGNTKAAKSTHGAAGRPRPSAKKARKAAGNAGAGKGTARRAPTKKARK